MKKRDLYDQLAAQLSGLLAGERDLVANAANFSALIFHSLPDLNWAGFYFAKDDELVLGPFQGQPACVRIRVGQGVCGAGAARGKVAHRATTGHQQPVQYHRLYNRATRSCCGPHAGCCSPERCSCWRR